MYTQVARKKGLVTCLITFPIDNQHAKPPTQRCVNQLFPHPKEYDMYTRETDQTLVIYLKDQSKLYISSDKQIFNSKGWKWIDKYSNIPSIE